MDYYDDPGFSYPQFWATRQYEHESEIIALHTLLVGKKTTLAADIGGGFGRLSMALIEHAKRVILVEPSVVQRKLAVSYTKGVEIHNGTAEHTGLPPQSCDLALMVRVLHHIPDPKACFTELWRIAKPESYIIVELANSLNVKSRIRHVFSHKLQPIPYIKVSKLEGDIPYVNHNPIYIKKILREQGFAIYTTLSVSNFRSTILKRVIPLRVLLWFEKRTQSFFGLLYFGPSIFILAKRPYGLKEKGLIRDGGRAMYRIR